MPGAIRAIVSEDVHSFDGTRVLIPRGARLVGRYRSDVALAQSRVMVAWDRIILPDNQTVEISAFGGDELGRTGTTGFVDTRFAQRFGSAALISETAIAREGELRGRQGRDGLTFGVGLGGGDLACSSDFCDDFTEAGSFNVFVGGMASPDLAITFEH